MKAMQIIARLASVPLILIHPWLLTPALIALFTWGFLANDGTTMRTTFGILIVKAIIIGFFIYPRLWALMQEHGLAWIASQHPEETRSHRELVADIRAWYERDD